MKDTIEIYVQPGKHGLHAGGRSPCTAWAAHASDETTAAWRCALRHWFPKRANGVLLYTEARAVTVDRIGEHEFRASLELPDKSDGKTKLVRQVTPLLPMKSRATKRTRTKAKK